MYTLVIYKQLLTKCYITVTLGWQDSKDSSFEYPNHLFWFSSKKTVEGLVHPVCVCVGASIQKQLKFRVLKFDKAK